MYDYIICHLCKKYGIPYFNFSTLSIIKNRVLLHENFPDKNNELVDKYNNIKLYWDEKGDGLSFSQNFQNYWDSVISQKVKPPLFLKEKGN